jgi:HAD superfamily hydrolase (TIGR01509 family)
MINHIIFDCDGVLVDSEPLSMRADVELLASFGITISEEEAHHRFVGTTFQAMLVMMSKEHGVKFPDNLHEIKNRRVEELYHSELQIVAGVKNLLADLAVRGIGCSIGSNSPKSRVELAVNLVGIAESFQRITTFEDVVAGKPRPDIFLKAAELAGVPLAQCLVVEDSVTGVTAAVAAGIKTIGFVGTHGDPHVHGKALLALGANAVINSMDELPLHLV